MNKNELVEANLESGTMIRKLDALNYFVKQIRININPSDPQHPSQNERIVCHTPEVWQVLNRNESRKQPISYIKAGGMTSAKVISDPTLWTKEQRKDIQDYYNSIFPVVIMSNDELQPLRDEIKRLKKKVGIHNF